MLNIHTITPMSQFCNMLAIMSTSQTKTKKIGDQDGPIFSLGLKTREFGLKFGRMLPNFRTMCL